MVVRPIKTIDAEGVEQSYRKQLAEAVILEVIKVIHSKG